MIALAVTMTPDRAVNTHTKDMIADPDSIVMSLSLWKSQPCGEAKDDDPALSESRVQEGGKADLFQAPIQ